MRTARATWADSRNAPIAASIAKQYQVDGWLWFLTPSQSCQNAANVAYAVSAMEMHTANAMIIRTSQKVLVVVLVTGWSELFRTRLHDTG